MESSDTSAAKPVESLTSQTDIGLQQSVVVDGETVIVGDLVNALRHASSIIDEVVFLRAVWGAVVRSVDDRQALEDLVREARQRLPGSQIESFDAGRSITEVSENQAVDVSSPVLEARKLPKSKEESLVSIHRHRESLRQLIATEGYCPEVTKLGNISLQFQGSTLFLMIDEEDLEFIAVHRYVDLPEYKDKEAWLPFVAAGEANGAFKCTKVDWNVEQCRATVSAEGFFADVDALRPCLQRLLRAADSAALRFSEKLEELAESEESETAPPASDTPENAADSVPSGNAEDPAD